MNVKERALMRAVEGFEKIGFMEWHARVLNALTVSPRSVREISRQTGLFHYQVRGVVMDLHVLDLVECTRLGVQLSDEWGMLDQLVSCCEEERDVRAFDYDALFEVVRPKVLALKKKCG